MKPFNYLRMFFYGLTSNFLVRNTIYHKVCARILKNKEKKYIYKKSSVLHSFTQNVNTEELFRQASILKFDKEIINNYMQHKFNLLGSGWVYWGEGTKTTGYCGIKYNESIRIGNSKKYNKEAIAWNVDVRTGYEFEQKYYYSNLIPNLPEAVEIKIPWEIGRMYHWPYLALYSVTCGITERNKIILEFLNQIDDFMLQNEIGIGVQFFCAMEVAIRSVNLLLAYDVFKQLDSNNILNQDFCRRLENYLYHHGTVIRNNIEVDLNGGINGNHYLSDLLGLLWIDMYYGNIDDFHKVRQLFLSEIQKQFFNDGTNFECSTGYHRLTSEIVALGILAIGKVDGLETIPKLFFHMLKGMRRLLINFTGLDCNMIQIGDLDSGRVLKLFPVFLGEEENTLGTKDIIRLISSLLKNKQEGFSLVSIFGLTVKDNYFIDKDGLNGNIEINNSNLSECLNSNLMSSIYKKSYIFKLPKGSSFSDTKIIIESTFGLIKVEGVDIELYIRCAPNYRLMNISHAHEDVFHYEFCTKTKRFFPDCGSVAYTSSKRYRDFFSTVKGHNVPIHYRNIINRKNIFTAEYDDDFCSYYSINSHIITIVVQTNKYLHKRIFDIHDDFVEIVDISNEPFENNMNLCGAYSLGYGQLCYRI